MPLPAPLRTFCLHCLQSLGGAGTYISRNTIKKSALLSQDPLLPKLQAPDNPIMSSSDLCGPGVSLCDILLKPYRTCGKGTTTVPLQMRKQAQGDPAALPRSGKRQFHPVYHVSRVSGLYQPSFQTIPELAGCPSWGTWAELSFSVLTDISRGCWRPEVVSATYRFVGTLSTQESLCSKMIKILRKKIDSLWFWDCLNGLINIFNFFFFTSFCFSLYNAFSWFRIKTV